MAVKSAKKRAFFSGFTLAGFTLVELLVVLVIMVVTMRFVLPTFFSSNQPNGLPEIQWMRVLRAAQKEAKKTGDWLELIPEKPIRGVVWHWDSRSANWGKMAWKMPASLSQEALLFQLKTPFPEQHLWVAPIGGAIPFVQGVCSGAVCAALAPSGEVLEVGSAEIVNRAVGYP